MSSEVMEMDDEQVYWQVANGDGSRDTSATFIKYGIAAIGPGDWGDYRTSKAIYIERKEWFVRQIAEEVLPGHRIVLRSGAREVLAVGVVCPAEDARIAIDDNTSAAYKHLEAFGDIDGQDWQHTVRVTWNPVCRKFSTNITSPSPPRLSRFSSAEVRKFVEDNLPTDTTPLPNLPPEPTKITISDIAEELFSCGLSNASVELTEEAIERIRRQLNWYRSAGYPTEHETVSHMVVPLLLGLGWSEQQLAVEWNYIDVAAFGTAARPKEVRRPDNCKMIVEVKRIGEGLWWAEKQAQGYLDSKKLSSTCERVVVTDGVRYNVLNVKTGESYYINLDHDKLVETTLEGKRSVDALRCMLPQVFL